VAFQHGSNADFYLAGTDATGYCDTVSVDGEVDTAEVTTLGKTAKSYIPGLEDASVSFSGFFDANAAADPTSFSYKLDSLRRTITRATYVPQLDVLGAANYFIEGELTKAKVETPVDDAGNFESEFQSSTGYERGVTLHLLTAETATGNQTSVDQTAASSNGAAAVLHVMTVTGTGGPTLVAKVQHAIASGGPWVDLITFASATTAGNSQRVAVAGTVNQFVRAQYTITGTTPSFAFHLAFSRK
jgi:hypothetical protein